LLIVAVLYILCNIAYFAAGQLSTMSIGNVFLIRDPVPKAELKKSEQIAASLLFSNVFGSRGATRGLSFLIAVSAFGNLIAVLVGQSRMIRECAR
jgi:amino acid transporter